MSDQYKQLEQREHIYRIPNMYVGSTDRIPTPQWVVDGRRLVQVEVSTPQALQQIILEVISNAGDNVGRSRRRNVDPGRITIEMDETSITVVNGGLPIPLVKNSESKLWNPTLIFGELLTSSNYEGTRHEGGMNGYGAKLTNIFSTRFEVVVGDRERGKVFQQLWTENMRHRTEPLIRPYDGYNFVKVSFSPDFQRFGYQEPKFDDVDFRLVHRMALDCSLTNQVKVMFNDQKIKVDLVNYARYLIPELPEYLNFKTLTTRVIILDTPDNGQSISFVNGIPTPDGGVHVDAVYEALKKVLLSKLDGALKQANERLQKINGKKITISLDEVRHHLTVIVCSQLENPQYSGQLKSRITGPKSRITFNTEQKGIIQKWSVVDRLIKMIESKVGHLIPKTARKTKYLKGDIRCEDANWAGTAKSEQCILCLVEGLSASAYPSRLFEKRLGANFRNRVGVLPLQGKLLNTMNTDDVVILNNKVIKKINTVLGLDPTCDYTDEADLKKLRYGQIIILSDADVDGKHITGLVINYLLGRHPGLAQHGRILSRRTPIVRVVHKRSKKVIKFYSLQQFKDWRQVSDLKLYSQPEYFKGLASSSPGEIAADAGDDTDYLFTLDDNYMDYLKLAFDDTLSDQRKKWIQQYDPEKQVVPVGKKEVSVGEFINTELIEFSIDDLRRSLPSEMDGLKVSQRKILEAVFRHWGSKSDRRLLQDTLTRYKTGRLANYASEQTSYVHGESCLATTIAKMAQVFVGSNNMPLLELDSEFGTRNYGGKDAGDPRYTYTHPFRYLEQLFPKVDFALLEYQYDEDKRIEPKFFLPIVPLHVINGALGIGTGHSCFIPKYHPIEVIDWYIARLEGKPVPQLQPWYRGFTGAIDIIGDVYPDTDEDGDTDDEESKLAQIPSRVGYARFRTTGMFKEVRRNGVVITELPIGRWTNDYIKWLHELRNRKELSDVIDLCTAEKINIEIRGFQKKPTAQNLRLTRSYPMSNMVLLDRDFKPVHLRTIDQVLNRFAQLRLYYYHQRREYIIEGLRARLHELTEKHRFISAKLSGELVLEGRTKEEIEHDIKELGLSSKYLTTVKLFQLTADGQRELSDEIRKVNDELERVSATDAVHLWIEDLKALRDVLIKRDEFKSRV